MSEPEREEFLPEGPIDRPHIRSIEEAERWIGILHYRSITDGDRLMLLDLRLRKHMLPWWAWRRRQRLDQWIEVAKANVNSRSRPRREPLAWPVLPNHDHDHTGGH